MKVAIIGRLMNHGAFEIAIKESLRELGHDVSTHALRMSIEPRRGRLANLGRVLRENVSSRSSRLVRTMYGAMLRELRASKPDLIITTQGRASREEVTSWRESVPGAPVVLWFPDALVNFGRQQAFCAGYDRIYVKDQYLAHSLFERCHCREVRYLAEGAPQDAVQWAIANPIPERVSNLAMVGNIHPTRIRFLEALLEELPIDIFGHLHNDIVPEDILHRFAGRNVLGAEKFRIYRDARAVIDNLHYAEVGGVNFRLFEATACRGAVLIDDVPQVRRYFEPGSEVLVFSSPEDLVGTMRDITSSELTAIGEAAHARTLREHLITHRLQEMMEDLGV